MVSDACPLVSQLEYCADRVEDAYEFRYVNRPPFHRPYLYLLGFRHLVIVVQGYDGGS